MAGGNAEMFMQAVRTADRDRIEKRELRTLRPGDAGKSGRTRKGGRAAKKFTPVHDVLSPLLGWSARPTLRPVQLRTTFRSDAWSNQCSADCDNVM